MKPFEKALVGAVGTAGAGVAAWRTMFPWIGYDLQMINVGRRMMAKREEALQSFIIDKFEAHAAATPKKPFVIFEDSVYTYEYVDQMACKVANMAKGWGLKALDVVAIMIQNEPAFIWTFLGLQKLGITVAFINYNLKKSPLSFSILAAKPQLLIVGEGESLLEAVIDVREELGPMKVYVQGLGFRPAPHGTISFDPLFHEAHSSAVSPVVRKQLTMNDICCYIYTSGTTGNPKPAFISYMKAMGIACPLLTVDLNANDRVYVALPLYHSAGGGIGTFGAILQGYPKPVFVRHTKAARHSIALQSLELTPSDIFYLILPMYHSAGGALALFGVIFEGLPKATYIRHFKTVRNSIALQCLELQSSDLFYLILPLYHSAGGGLGLFGVIFQGYPKPVNVLHMKSSMAAVVMNITDFSSQDVMYTVLPLYHVSGFYLGVCSTISQGFPKPAYIWYRKSCLQCCVFNAVDLQPSDTVYVVLPLYHSAGGGTALFGIIQEGATIVLRKRFSASHFWEDCCRHDVTVIQYIGELFRYLLGQPPSKYDTGHKVRAAFGNGLRKDIWLDVEKRFKIPQIVEFFGATEGTTILLNVANKPGAIGRLSPFMSMIDPDPKALVKFDMASALPVRDKNGRCIKVNVGEPGLFISKVPEMLIQNGKFEVYKSSKEANEKKLVRDAFAPGDLYFNYGDVFVQDKDYFLYFRDRIGDTFRWKGENVSTTELANVITQLDFVNDANVYGVTIPGNDGRAGMVALTLNDGHNMGDKELKQLYSHVSEKLPSYAQPLFLRVLGQAIITGTFKQRKVELVEEAYDMNKVKDPLFYLNRQKKTYSPLSPPDLSKFLTSKL